MTLTEWTKEVKKKLIERDETISHMAQEIGFTRPWIYVAFKGNATHRTYERINDYLGIESEVENVKKG